MTDYLLAFDEVTLTLGLDSVMSDPIIVKEILVQGPAAIYEMANGGSNLDLLLNNIKSYTGGGGNTDDSAGSGPKLVIEDIYVNDGQVSINHSLLKGKTLVLHYRIFI